MSDKMAKIFQAARALFQTKGYKDTNISEIAAATGIGVGTFYNYYASKEEIFLEVYMKENEDLKNRLFESINPNDDPVTLVTKIVTQNAVEMNSNSILKEWYNKDLFSKLERYFYKQGGMESIEELSRSGFTELIKKWKAGGIIRDDLDDELIIAICNAIPFIDLHKSEIGIQHFPHILFYITEFIMKGLTEKPPKNR